MQSTPTKKQATQQNGIITPQSSRPGHGDMRGQMASYTPEDLKAQLASRPRSVRSAVSQGYAGSPRAPLTSHRSEPTIMPGYSSSSSSSLPASPSPSPSRPLMPMCDTFSSAHSSPSSSIASFAYHNSTQSILARAHESYMLHWSPSARSPSGASAGSGPSPRKRVQMDDDDDDEVILPLSSQQGLVGAEAYDDTMMDEDGDETMIMMMEDGDVPSSSRSMTNITTRHGIPPLSFSNSNSSGSNSSSSSSSSASDMFFAPRTESTSSSSTITSITQNRQMKTMPKRRGALGKTQSLPVDAFISQIGNTQNQIFVPDVFNATDGF